MQMRVRERNNEVEIHFSGLAGRQHAVLAAFSPDNTGERPVDHAKLESLSLRARADAMHIRLRAKSGESFDVSDLYRCLRRALIEGQRVAFAAPLANLPR